METSTTTTFLEILSRMTEEERATVRELLGVGGKAGKSGKAAGGAGAGAVGRPKKAADPRASVPLPEVEEGGELPEAADYRLPAEEIQEGVCMARTTPRGDKRWSVELLFEGQCGKEVVEGSDLCETCARRAEAYAAAPKPGKWNGLITEEPPSWMHMLGTAWATQARDSGKLKWRGVEGDAASATGSEESAASSKMSAAAAKAAKAAEREAAKVAKAAEREAAKAAKEAERQAAKAAKEAEKAAAKAAKPKSAPKPKKAAAAPAVESAAAGAGAAAAAVPAKADSAAEAVATDGEIKYIGGEMYWARGDKIYAYDIITEAVGEFVGRLKADGETLDGDADEDSDEE